MGILYVAAVGAVEEEDLILAETALWHSFGHEVRRASSLVPDPAALDGRRDQWNSSLLLRQVVPACPADGLLLLGLTAADLFIPMLSFVFGQAQLDGTAALVSTARLRQEFYGLPANRTLFSGRLVKEAIHEVGHALGLVHCSDPACPMSLSTTIRQVDHKGSEFCPNCLLILDGKPARAGGTLSGSTS